MSPAQICGHHGVSFPPSGLGWCLRRAVCAQPRSAPGRTQHPAAAARSGFHLARQRAAPGHPKNPKLNPNSYPKLTKFEPNSLADAASTRVFRHHLQLARGWRAAGGCCGLRPSSGLPNGAETGSGHQTPATTGHRAPWGSRGHPASARSPPAAPRHQLAGAAHGAG